MCCSLWAPPGEPGLVLQNNLPRSDLCSSLDFLAEHSGTEVLAQTSVLSMWTFASAPFALHSISAFLTTCPMSLAIVEAHMQEGWPQACSQQVTPLTAGSGDLVLGLMTNSEE